MANHTEFYWDGNGCSLDEWLNGIVVLPVGSTIVQGSHHSHRFVVTRHELLLLKDDAKLVTHVDRH